VAEFITSAPTHARLPEHGLPEVAFAGRSNVGKSSLVGTLMGQPKLVRTSRTPGRTQLLNLFIHRDLLAIVDLPGYGYAKLSHTDRRRLSLMMRQYVAARACLRGVVVVLDARRETPSELDCEMVTWAMQANRQVLLAVTKCDLVPKNRRLHQTRLLEKAMGVPQGCALMCSSKTQEGLKELHRRLMELDPK
jgi:GTP-binding protein